MAMMPAGTAPLPSVEEVRRIVSLCKDIIFTDYFHKRQSDEQLRAYHIGVGMDELYTLLRRQIARGLQFCEDCSENDVMSSAEEMALRLLRYVGQNYPQALIDRYKLSEGLPETTDELLPLIGKKRGFLLKGGLADTEKTARLVLTEFRTGLWGRLTLETPGEI